VSHGPVYEKEPVGSFCAPGASRMGLTDRIGRSASPTGLLILPGSDFRNSYSLRRTETFMRASGRPE
jgi:hypothetical protein